MRSPGAGLLLSALVLVGCFEFSPHALPTDPDELDLNARALRELEARPPRLPLRFAVVGDTQFFFDETEQAVEGLRRRDDLDFVVQVGDFTELGLLSEYRLMNDLFRRLPVPYLVVVGNHDLLGNGGQVYERMFGPRAFSFSRGRTRFVAFDSNSREAGFDGRVPDLAWLASQGAPAPEHDRTVFLSHVPPWNEDHDPALRQAYLAVARAAAPALSVHGHEHRFRTGTDGGVPVVVADVVTSRTYLVITVEEDGRFTVEQVGF
jgi:3',5'-cyclic AMP phosphodiesterase CpdA